MLGPGEAGARSSNAADNGQAKHDDPRDPQFCPISRHSLERRVNRTVENRRYPRAELPRVRARFLVNAF
jgi:hypothetical protein